MRNYRLSRPPHSLRRSAVYLDNSALVPASLLPFKSEWQAIADALSPGEILIVLPWRAKQRRVARAVAALLREKGRSVRVADKDSRQMAV